MARSSVVLFMFLIMCASLMSHSHGRRLLAVQENQRRVPSPADSLYLSALPKGTTPPSSPSKKGHAVVIDEKLIARHLAAVDRILRSVPSPGVGH